MKSLKKTLALVLSLVMLVSVMAVPAYATEGPSKTTVAATQFTEAVEVKVDSVTYNGSTQTGKVTVTFNGKTLVEGKDYKITKPATGTDTGNYTVEIEGIGDYAGKATGTFTIKANPKGKKSAKATIKAKKASVKLGKKKATAKINVKIKAKNNKAQPIYKIKAYPKKTKAKQKKLVTINQKTGKITFKKGAKKGTYKIKVMIPRYNNFKGATKTITITLK